MRIPFNKNGITPLSEDLDALGLLPKRQTPQTTEVQSEAESAENTDSEGANQTEDDVAQEACGPDYMTYDMEYDDEESMDYDDESMDDYDDYDMEYTYMGDDGMEYTYHYSYEAIDQADKALRVMEEYNKLDEDERAALTADDTAAVLKAREVFDEQTVVKRKGANGAIQTFKLSPKAIRKLKLAGKKGAKVSKNKPRKAPKPRLARKTPAVAAQIRKNRQKRRAESTEEIGQLLSEIKELTTSGIDNGAETAQQLSDDVFATLENIRATAEHIAEAIADELRQEEDLQREDARFEIGTYFEGLANDAAKVMDVICSRQVAAEDVVNDLKALSRDLVSGIEYLKNVD